MKQSQWAPILAAWLVTGMLLPIGAEDKVDAEGYTEVEMKFIAHRPGRAKEGYEFLPFTCPGSLDAAHWGGGGGGQMLPFPYGDQGGFKCTTLETSLEIDLNNDGKVDTKAKGKDTVIPCQLVSAEGVKYDYCFRVTRVETGGADVDWIYQRSCYVEGTYDSVKIRVIDDNTDGIYGQFGRDAIAIGNDADHAAPLGPVVNIKNKLYRLKLNASGTRLGLKPFDGPTGRIDVVKGYATLAKLVWAVFRGGDSWFDCAVKGKDTEVVVPVGSYALEMGRVYGRPQGARIRNGSLSAVEVKADQVATLEWGGPVKLDFSYNFEGRILKIDPQQITAVGRGGEVYWRWEPEDLTPKVVIRNQASKKLVHKGTIILDADRRVYDPAWWMWRAAYSEQVKNEEGPFEVYLEEDQFGKLFPGVMVGDWK